MPKDKADELYERIASGRVDNYFKKLSNADFDKLATAIADDNVDEMIDTLKDNLKKSFSGFESAMNDNYDTEIRALASRILERDATPKREEIIAKIPEVEEVIRPPPEAELPKPVRVEVTPEKRYRRTRPKRFTTRENKFLTSRVAKTGRQVYEDYLRVFGNVRTKSSITTKFYRVRR